MKKQVLVFGSLAIMLAVFGCDIQTNGNKNPTVIGVIVTESPLFAKKGGTAAFAATVSGENNPDQTVTWTIETFGVAAGTTLSGNVLTVAADEVQTTITVRATSTADANKTGTATVRVVAADTADAAIEAASAFLRAFSTPLSFTETGIAAFNGPALAAANEAMQAALAAYDALTLEAKALLTEEKTKLDSLFATISTLVDGNIIYMATRADGRGGMITTTGIILTFTGGEPTGLTEADITITGATKGTLTGTGTTRIIGISEIGVANSGRVKVKITKTGIETAEKDVMVYVQIIPPKSLMTAFSISGSDATAVTNTFNAIHTFLQSNTTTAQIKTKINLGDYIDLPQLTVAAIDGKGGISVTNIDLGTNARGWYMGKWLRLIVVGINSFNGINGNGTTAHVVFHFQNCPGTYWMHNTVDASVGYSNSLMRTYLTTNYLTGLTTAGVPDSVLWAPKRIVASNGGSSPVPVANTIDDKLWLPTEREIFGSNRESVFTIETQVNQANFSTYYNGIDDKIRKYVWNSSWNLGESALYWLASPGFEWGGTFVSYSSGSPRFDSAYYDTLSVAPAFCVK